MSDLASDTVVSVDTRTQLFARVIGPFVTVVATVIAVRLTSIDGVLADLHDNEALVWLFGGILLLAGVIIIAFHQNWKRATAALISLFGWFLALRGLAMLAYPQAIETGAQQGTTGSGAIAGRVFFVLLAFMGLWLTYVGWIAPSRSLTADQRPKPRGGHA